MGNPVQSAPTAVREDESPIPAKPRSRTTLLLIGFAVVALVAGVIAWNYYSVRESTDDAEIEGHIHPISARVGGTVIGVHIHENQMVASDAILIELDPKDYQVALEKAQADLAEAEAALAGSRIDLPIITTTTSSQLSSAEAGVLEARANVSSSEKEIAAATARLASAQAKVREVQANHNKADRDLDRMKQLIAKEEISQQQYDAAVAEAQSLGASLESAQADVAVAEQGLKVAQSHVERDQAKLAQSQAAARAASTGAQQVDVTKSKAESAAARVNVAKTALDQAQLNFQYTTIRAPIGGEISKKNVETGQIVQAGQPMFSIVPPEDIWIQANFKETQLRNVRPGQAVNVSVDAFGGRTYKGHVDSISAATGAKFSLLPPENATGNYVKVVQRVPVRILLDKDEDPEHRLRPGMSVVPTIFTK
jgi:membrane fusion protein, multidrug efflux system